MANNINDLHFLRDLIQQIPGLILVMDLKSRFLYSNQYTAKLFGYQKEGDILGLDAYGIRCPATDSAVEFIKQDRKVIVDGEELTILDIHTYANDVSKMWLTKKTPFRQNGEIIGTICHCTELQSKALSQLCASLMQTDRRYYAAQNNKERSYVISTVVEARNVLSKREQDCLFYLLRGKTMKQTARALSVSPRTVETHLEHIREKLDLQDRSEVVEYALSQGYLNYIPEEYLPNNFTKIVHSDRYI